MKPTRPPTRQPTPTPTAVLCELAKLRAQQQFLDHSHKEFEKHFPTDMQYFRSESNTRFDEYQNEKWADVHHISDTIRHFRQTMLNQYGLQCHQTSEFRDEILRIDTMLKEATSKNDAEILDLYHKKTMYTATEDDNSEMASLMSTPSRIRYGAYPRPGASGSSAVRKHSVVDRDSNMDVQRFFDFRTRHNGHTGGWSNEEHQLYVRLKAKNGGNVQLIVETLQGIPGNERTEEQIVQHDKWYDKYIELKQKYRTAIKEWKQQNEVSCPK